MWDRAFKGEKMGSIGKIVRKIQCSLSRMSKDCWVIRKLQVSGDGGFDRVCGEYQEQQIDHHIRPCRPL